MHVASSRQPTCHSRQTVWCFLGICMLLPRLVVARIGMTAWHLTSKNFQDFIGSHDRLIIDFFDSKDPDAGHHQQELQRALMTVRSYGNLRVPFGKVDAQEEPVLCERFVKNSRFPQLVWFVHGEPTQYHRTLRTSSMIADFVMALDRDAITRIGEIEQTEDYNRAVLAKIQRASPLFKTVET
eukprot:1482950-Amphidinium_carterae.1